MSEITSTLYVELDCILDTRLGTIYKLGIDAVNQVLINNYQLRIQDDFYGVDYDWFHNEYRQRDKSILKNSIRTRMFNFLIEFSNKTVEANATTPYAVKPKICLNIYPYLLSGGEINILIDTLVHVTEQRCDVEVMRTSPINITTELVNRTYSIMIMYDYMNWIEHHCVTKQFEKTQCRGVKLIAPAIYFKKIRPEEYNPNNFIDAQCALSCMIGLTLLPIQEFCLDIPAVKLREA
jgi:hypothetical protein